MIYKYNQLTKRLTYDQAKKIINDDKKLDSNLQYQSHSMHLGQLKLLISEVFFLTKFYTPNAIVLYVGAAKGYHINYLATMFPKLFFHLWDAQKFDVEITNNIKIFPRLFMDRDAESYRKMNTDILFVSDIRNLDIAEQQELGDEKEIEKIVSDDMLFQMRWVQTIKPIAASLKFRLPYNEIKPVKYLSGTIYLQTYSPHSTETRLVTDNYTDLIDYQPILFDERLAYFNACIRHKKTIYPKWHDLLNEYNIAENWDNVYVLSVLRFYLRKMKDNNSKIDTIKLYLDIIQFHKKRQGNRYLVIFASNKKS
jgi:hypothetical protein